MIEDSKLSGDEPADVLNYAKSNPVFPHESTSNQFFTEAVPAEG